MAWNCFSYIKRMLQIIESRRIKNIVYLYIYI